MRKTGKQINNKSVSQRKHANVCQRFYRLLFSNEIIFKDKDRVRYMVYFEKSICRCILGCIFGFVRVVMNHPVLVFFGIQITTHAKMCLAVISKQNFMPLTTKTKCFIAQIQNTHSSALIEIPHNLIQAATSGLITPFH